MAAGELDLLRRRDPLSLCRKQIYDEAPCTLMAHLDDGEARLEPEGARREEFLFYFFLFHDGRALPAAATAGVGDKRGGDHSNEQTTDEQRVLDRRSRTDSLLKPFPTDQAKLRTYCAECMGAFMGALNTS